MKVSVLGAGLAPVSCFDYCRNADAHGRSVVSQNRVHPADDSGIVHEFR
jgi:hypothetical protein